MIRARCKLLNSDYITPNIIDMTISGNLINRNTQPIIQLSIEETHFPIKAGENGTTFEIEQDLDIYKLKIVEGDIIRVSDYNLLVIELL